MSFLINLSLGFLFDAGLVISGMSDPASGCCPGPALAAIGLGATGTLFVVPTMILGMRTALLLAERGIQSLESSTGRQTPWHRLLPVLQQAVTLPAQAQISSARPSEDTAH